MFSLSLLTYANVEVTATGQAAGRGRIAKQQALADALRKAVRKGVGINIMSSTKVRDYVLSFDNIFARAFGYVKNFKILSSGPDKTGIYNVKISALVSKGSPKINDYMAMRQIITLKGSPRLLIKASGEIKNIGDARKLIDGQLREIALQCGFQTIKISQFNEFETKRIKRDNFLGNNEIRDNYDFIINVAVSGAYNGKSELYNMPTQRFSFGADLAATYPNGNSIAQVTIPSKEVDIIQVTEKTQAARAALHKTLGADKGKNFRSLLLRVLASWVSEFDTGAKITIEFTQISSDLFEKVIDRLKKAKGINAINIREFDEKRKSIIEVESNLSSYDLSKLINILSDNQLTARRTTNDYIQMSVAGGFNTADILVTILGAIIVFILLLLIVKSLKSDKANK